MNKRSRGRGGRVILVFLFSCHLVSFLVFCKGFMLKRVVIPEYSKCTHPHNMSNGRQSCNLYPRPFKRVLWLLVDALRYDFTVYEEEPKDGPWPVYRNKMPYIRDLLQTHPENARLFKFVADPPTTTMQRLKALTTGSLPTFIDIGSNFNSYAVSEDSLPYQAKQNCRNVTFIGDDTWLGLYPDMLTKAFDYPSLNVQDLDTVDNGVQEKLGPELAKGDAEMVIGHMLGVDHVGHTYGPSHWTMGEKLTQMNNFIQHIFTELLDEDTVAFVFGDHGMSPMGDHGGETDLETNAALLVYSPRPLFNPSEPALGREVYQIDLVPTTALVLGLPVPFSNLGMLIPEVLLPFNGGGSPDGGSSRPDDAFGGSPDGSSRPDDAFGGRVTLDFLTALRANAEQIRNYLITYTQYSQDFPRETFAKLEADFSHVVRDHQDVLGVAGEGRSQDKMTRVAGGYFSYMREVKAMCQSIWAKFDITPMALGLGLLVLTVLTTPLMLLNVSESSTSLSDSILIGVAAGVVGTVLSALFAGVEGSLLGLLILVETFSLFSLSATISVFVWKLKPVVYQSVSVLRRGVFHILYQLKFQHILSIGVVFLYALSLLSNSFILYEADMLSFFIQSLICGFAVRLLRKELSGDSKESSGSSLLKIVVPHVALMGSVRLSKLFYACRDLQIQDGCESTTFILSLASAVEFLGPDLTVLRFLASVLAHYFVCIGVLVYLRRSGCHRYLSPFLAKGCELGLLLSVFYVTAHWYTRYYTHSPLAFPAWLHVALPWAVYTICVAIVALCVARPFGGLPKLLSCEDPSLETSTPPSVKTVCANLERNKMATGIPVRTRVVMVTIILLAALWSPAAMVLNDGIALSAALSAAEMVLALRILQHYEEGVSWEVCVLWSLLGSHSFFSFGHHATVTSLRFEAAFVGIHGEITPYNLPLAAVLVGFNTIASQVFFGLGFPLLLGLGNGRGLSPSQQLLSPMIMYSGLNSIKLLVTMVAACLHRRHLMVWWVFAPRFLYEGAFQATADIAMLLAASFVARLECMVHR